MNLLVPLHSQKLFVQREKHGYLKINGNMNMRLYAISLINTFALSKLTAMRYLLLLLLIMVLFSYRGGTNLFQPLAVPAITSTTQVKESDKKNGKEDVAFLPLPNPFMLTAE